MAFPVFTKDPLAQLDYGFDWTPYLNGLTIASSSWIIPTGLTKISQAASASVATVLLSGGTLAREYDITNQITVSDGTIDQRTMTLLIQKR
jgi:hypothetical protein